MRGDTLPPLNTVSVPATVILKWKTSTWRLRSCWELLRDDHFLLQTAWSRHTSPPSGDNTAACIWTALSRAINHSWGGRCSLRGGGVNLKAELWGKCFYTTSRISPRVKGKKISDRIKRIDGDIHLFFSERFSDSVLSVIWKRRRSLTSFLFVRGTQGVFFLCCCLDSNVC